MITILVFGEMDEVAHELLERRDLDLRWALTIEEAMAASHTSRIDLVVSSDPYAFTYLMHHVALPRRPPCVVVLGPDAEGRGPSYLSAGATVIVPKEAQKILEALSDLTGLAFRLHPRVAVETILDVEIAGKRSYRTSIDLSLSGVAIVGVADNEPGTMAKIGFEMFDPPLRVEAMVVRSFNRRGVPCAGLYFTEIAPDDRRRLRDFITQMIETIDIAGCSFGGPAGQDTRDLMSLLAQEGDEALATYLCMLVEVAKGDRSRAPAWIIDLARELTETELRSLEFDRPAWGRAAVGMRLVLRAQVMGEGSSFDTSAVLELCRVIAFEAVGASEQEASDATVVRAGLLRDASRIHRARIVSKPLGKAFPAPKLSMFSDLVTAQVDG